VYLGEEQTHPMEHIWFDFSPVGAEQCVKGGLQQITHTERTVSMCHFIISD
jgi:hypothetical protein